MKEHLEEYSHERFRITGVHVIKSYFRDMLVAADILGVVVVGFDLCAPLGDTMYLS